MQSVDDIKMSGQDFSESGNYTLDDGTTQYLSSFYATRINFERRKAGKPRLRIASNIATNDETKKEAFKKAWRDLKREIGFKDFSTVIAELIMESEPSPVEESTRQRSAILAVNDLSNNIFHKMINGSQISPISMGVMGDFVRHRLKNKIGRADLADLMTRTIERAVSKYEQESSSEPEISRAPKINHPDAGTW